MNPLIFISTVTKENKGDLKDQFLPIILNYKLICSHTHIFRHMSTSTKQINQNMRTVTIPFTTVPKVIANFTKRNINNGGPSLVKRAILSDLQMMPQMA